MGQNKNFLKPLIAIIVLSAVVVIMLTVYYQQKTPASQGAKKIVVEVVIPDEKTKEFTIQTDAENLRQALEEESLIKGNESEYGLFITEVDGRVASDANQEWWCITKGGEAVFDGVDMILINDGDHYEITLTVGY